MLAIEIGELAAWVALGFGAERPGKRWRAQFSAPPALDELLARIQSGARELSPGPVAGVGIATWASALGPGPIYLSGRDEGAALATGVGRMLAAPVIVRQAAQAAALAESREGERADSAPIVYIHLGREVLCSVISGGEALAGAHGLAGQIGHWAVSEDGPRCACGQIGHLNPLCSSQGLVRLAIGLISQNETALAAALTASHARVEALTAGQVVQLAHAGVTPLRELVELSAEALGVALARLTLLVDPARIVLGGPLGVAGLEFLEGARRHMAADLRAVSASWRSPEVIPARLEPYSALHGAWLLAHGLATDSES